MTANKQLYFVFDKDWHKRGCAKKSHKQPVENRSHLLDFAHTNNKTTTCDAIVIIYSTMDEIYFVVICVAYHMYITGQNVSIRQKTFMRLLTGEKNKTRVLNFM